MRSFALKPRAPCRERTSLFCAKSCGLCRRHRQSAACTAPARSRGKCLRSTSGFRVQSCAVAAPERHHTLYRSELGYRTDFTDHYSLLEIIGKGNFGTVWLAASREQPSHHVAVKVVPKTREDRTHEESLESIRREVAMWGSLSGDSRYVAELLGLYEDGHNVYLVQQLCQGGDLSEALKDGPLPEGCCAAVMWCVLSAIRDCHDHGLALIDVKPQNFLLTAAAGPSHGSGSGGCGDGGGGCGDGGGGRSDVRHLRLEDEMAAATRVPCVVACDFGCSLSYTELMRGAKRAGSPVFFAPEQFTSSYGLVVDEWAAGVMLYLLLSGRYPFWDCKREELDKSLPAYQVMLAVCSAPIAFGGPEWRGISREARDLVSQLLDRNPGTRITADAALKHPWFARWKPPRQPEHGEGAGGAAAATTAAAAAKKDSAGSRSTAERSSRRGKGWSPYSRTGATAPPPPAGGCCGGGGAAAAPSEAAGASGLRFVGPEALSACCGGSNIVPLLSPQSYAPAALPTSGSAPVAAAHLEVAGSDDDDPAGCDVTLLH